MKAVPIKSLNELIESGVIQLTRGKVISKRDIDACPGRHPIYSSAKENEGKFGEYGKFLFDEELITWSVDGGGRLFHRKKHKFSVTNVGGVLRILDRSVLEYRYLYYALTLRHSEIAFDWVKKAHPSVIRKLYKDIPLPPLPEQKRIAGILDKAFTAIATAEVAAEKNLQNARALFESHLNEVFTHKGKGWVEKTLENTVDSSCKLSYGIVQPGKDHPNGLPIVRPTDLTENVIRLDGLKRIDPKLAKSYQRTTLHGGDLLLCVRGSTGVVSIAADELVGANVTRGIVPIRFNTSIINPYFGYFLLRSGFFQDQIRANTYGAALMQINIRDLRNVLLSFPPLNEQNKVAAQLDSLSAATNRLSAHYARKLELLVELKKSLLHQAFAGEL